MLLSKMFGVEREEWFKVEWGGKALYKISAFEDNIEFLEVNYGGEQGWEFAKMNMLLCVINSAPSNIIHLPPPITNEQREQLRALWTLGYKWIAKDANGDAYAYEIKPQDKLPTTWWYHEIGDSYILCTKPTKCLDSLVSWADTEPYDISKALEIKR